MDPDDEPVSFLRGPPGPSFRTRVVTVAPGCSRPYDAAEWAGALVVVESGEIDLECEEGGRRRFRTGAVLWLCGLPLRALHNGGPEPAVLVAVSRVAVSRVAVSRVAVSRVAVSRVAGSPVKGRAARGDPPPGRSRGPGPT